eukprot:m.336954 g.336954  ORF g.336954 m.336954 type:complete len:1349 (+) comp27789_c0_seq9:223-4269(+)
MAVELTLRDYVLGHVLRTGMLQFEGVMGPWVKEKVREFVWAAHPNDQADEARAADEHTAAVTAHRTELERLTARVAALDAKMKVCPRTEKQKVAREKKETATQLGALTPVPPAAVPRWVEACRRYVGPKTKKHVHDGNRWDVHTIVAVMRALLPEVFAAHLLLDHFHAKELLDGILQVASFRTGRAHRMALTLADALGALQQMAAVVRTCVADDAATAIVTQLADAKSLVQQARTAGPGITCDGPTLTADEANAQLLYTAVTAWELHVEATMGLVTMAVDGTVTIPDAGGARLGYQDGTVAFGRTLENVWEPVVKQLNPRFPTVAWPRHWYFHNLEGVCDVGAALTAMEAVAVELEAAPAAVVGGGGGGARPWMRPLHTAATSTTLRLETPSVRMSVPVGRVGVVVGRAATVATLTGQMVQGGRVLLHGDPGVGKDTVMAEVAHRPEVQSAGGLQAWLHASSDSVFRRQLIELFATHRPRVVAGCKNDASAAVAEIKQWLAGHTEWTLFVEDANAGSATLWEVLPGREAGGRVLITSQAPLHTQHPMLVAEAHRLAPITTNESLELLREMNVFASKAPLPPPDETEAELEGRCKAAGAEVYVEAPDNEKSNARKQRRREIEGRLLEHPELGRPEFRTFLEEWLGNLPLSVGQCGHLLRASDRGVLEVIELYRQAADDLGTIDADGRNPMLDRHYYGLYLSVKITLSRLQGAGGVPEADRGAAVALLVVLSLLDRAFTPASLLTGHDAAALAVTARFEAGVGHGGAAALLASNSVERLMTLLSSEEALIRAQSLCVEHGLMQLPADGGSSIGVMHQLVQRCLRRELVVLSAAEGLGGVIRTVLLSRFDYTDRLTPSSRFSELQRMVPSVHAWLGNALGNGGGHDAIITWAEGDVDLLTRRGHMLLNVDGDAGSAKDLFETILTRVQVGPSFNMTHVRIATNNLAAALEGLGKASDALKLLSTYSAVDDPVHLNNLGEVSAAQGQYSHALEQHTCALRLREQALAARQRDPNPNPTDIALAKLDIAGSKNNLGATYSALGRHDEAFKCQKEALKIRRMYQPPDHPDVAFSMSNVADGYSARGQYTEALKMQTDVLKLIKMGRSADHPLIATAMNNLGNSHRHLGHLADALELHKAALAMRRRVLDSSHSLVAQSLSNYAGTLASSGEHQAAIGLHKEALSLREKVLPRDHPDIAKSMTGLAMAHSDAGEHTKAIEVYQPALASLQRKFPNGHPDIARCMTSLAFEFDALGRCSDALKLEEVAVKMLQSIFPSGHPDLDAAKYNLRETYSKLDPKWRRELGDWVAAQLTKWDDDADFRRKKQVKFKDRDTFSARLHQRANSKLQARFDLAA